MNFISVRPRTSWMRSKLLNGGKRLATQRLLQGLLALIRERN
jgi:hypothetical protein